MVADIKFGTDGWRAVIARDFTFDNLRLVTQAIGQYLKDNSLDTRGVFIGYDNRFLSEEFGLEAGKVLLSMGLKVHISNEAVPTPLTAFMVKDLKLDGALMITASHNPAIYNGIKFIPYYAGPALTEITEDIEKNLEMILNNKIEKLDISSFDNGSLVSQISVISDFDNYKKSLLSLINADLIKNSGLKVTLDTMNGAAFHIMPDILQNILGLELNILNGIRDPLFGGKLPEPSEKNL
ncbi:MAG: phosphoglucomutase/phosphomannomutase family protein, partial [Actinobacteria bacterium]|nr:phosphoglucomutase/phosphomannomutase family protein [Actinomycetota bacterium]